MMDQTHDDRLDQGAMQRCNQITVAREHLAKEGDR